MAKEKKNIENTEFTDSERKALIKEMKRLGLLLPTNDQELEEFENMYGSTKVIVPEHLRSGSFLFEKNIKPEEFKTNKDSSRKVTVKKASPSKNDYFKKLVLAAEIAYQLHEEPTFGHKKFVKVLFLAQEVCKMQLSTSYKKHAAGPLDGKFMHTIDAEFKNREWFKLVKREQYGFKYVPLDKVDGYKDYYERYFKNELDSISQIIMLFKKLKSDFCEIVATMYAVWKELIESNTLVNDATLMQGFYAWHPDKEKFKKSQLETAIEWMREQGIVPAMK